MGGDWKGTKDNVVSSTWTVLEEMTAAQLANKFPSFYATRKLITVFTRTCSYPQSYSCNKYYPRTYASISRMFSSFQHFQLKLILFPIYSKFLNYYYYY
jgi:hypothetical protein